MGSWSISAIPKLMKMTLAEQYGLVLASLMQWEPSIPVCNETKVSNLLSV
jgi:hypothetical protein